MPRYELGDLTRALCHPRRKHADKGLCRQCLDADKRNPPMGLAKVARQINTELMERHKDALYLEKLAAEAKAILRENVPRYAELHLAAAEEAAIKGDGRPMEWALQHVKFKDAPTVEPPAKEPVQSGVRVFVGINMGGVPTGTIPTITMSNPASDPPDSV